MTESCPALCVPLWERSALFSAQKVAITAADQGFGILHQTKRAPAHWQGFPAVFGDGCGAKQVRGDLPIGGVVGTHVECTQHEHQANAMALREPKVAWRQRARFAGHVATKPQCPCHPMREIRVERNKNGRHGLQRMRQQPETMNALRIVEDQVPPLAVGAIGERLAQDEGVMFGGAAKSPRRCCDDDGRWDELRPP